MLFKLTSTYLNRLGLVHALVRLEVVALPEVLRPDLAAVAVVLPELLAHSNRLVDALLDQLGRPRALLSAIGIGRISVSCTRNFSLLCCLAEEWC